jgi:hypothetical protein
MESSLSESGGVSTLGSLRAKEVRFKSVSASAYWMGHDRTLSGAMRDVYDNPEDGFAEQSARLPNGPMVLLETRRGFSLGKSAARDRGANSRVSSG